MRKLKINRTDFEFAFELNSSEAAAYLDSETGAVLIVESYAADQLKEFLSGEETLDEALETIQAQTDVSETDRISMINAAQIQWGGETRFLKIPRQAAQEEYRDMTEYIRSLHDAHLKEMLDDAIRGSRPFNRFKEVLNRYLEAREDWFEFKAARTQRRMQEWLNSEEIEPEFE